MHPYTMANCWLDYVKCKLDKGMATQTRHLWALFLAQIFFIVKISLNDLNLVYAHIYTFSTYFFGHEVITSDDRV